MRISAVSQQSGISIDTLRYYERIGLLPAVNRTDGGVRDYSELDYQRVEFIKCMRQAGLPIDVLIEYFTLVQQGDRSIEARKEILIRQRVLLTARMSEMQQTLDLLNYKIRVYEDVILKREMAIAQLED